MDCRLAATALGLALAVACAAIGQKSSAASDDTSRVLSIIGRNERVAIVDGGVVMQAKVDTGADSTSIDARQIEEFERDGEKWVRFETRTNADKVVTFEREVIDTVTIIGAGDEKQERLVVNIALCVGDVQRDVEVNLANRTGLEYRLLLGRGFLENGGFLVNVAQEFSHDPRCSETMER
jgi:hypothetical protein